MNRRLHIGGIAISLLAAPVVAEEPFACKSVSGGELRVYQGLGPAESKTPSARVKVKKGAVVVHEERALLVDWLKPDGGVGGVIPYKSPQMVFSRYSINGEERLCSTQRREDVFGAGDEKQSYQLRCLLDTNGDGQFDAFRRYGELVSYDSRSGKAGAATGTPQADQPLAQPFRLVPAGPADSPTPVSSRFVPVLRSVIQVMNVVGDKVTLRETSQVAVMAFDSDRGLVNDHLPSTTVEVQLAEGAEALVGQTRIRVARTSSGWEIFAPEGFVSDAELICGGTMLKTDETITVFKGGGFGVLRRNSES